MVLIAALLSILIGCGVGLFGGGGSILTTPLLIYVLGFDAKAAIAGSLFVVAVTSAFGLILYVRRGLVRWRTGLVFGGAGMVGAFVGGQIGVRLPGSFLLAAFAVMMATTAVAMIRGRRQVLGAKREEHPLARILLDGVIVGLVTGLVGAGGGFLVVPALVLLGGLPMSAAVGTSLLVVLMKSIAGLFGYLLVIGNGRVSLDGVVGLQWNILLLVAAMAVVGSLAGAGLSPRIHPDRLRRGFGWFVLMMAVLVLSLELGGSILDFARGSAIQAVEVVAGIVLIVAAITVLIRWPVRVPVGDFDDPGDSSKERPPESPREAR